MRHLTGLERNLDTMLLEEENNHFQHVLAMAICNRCLNLITLDFSEKTKVFLRRIKYTEEEKWINRIAFWGYRVVILFLVHLRNIHIYRIDAWLHRVFNDLS